MERIGVAVDDKRCGNCASYQGKCYSVETNHYFVYEHNVCRYFISRDELFESVCNSLRIVTYNKL